MFNGVGTAIITPYDDKLRIDYDALKKIIKLQLDAKMDTIVVLGTTGEAPVIKEEERKQIIKTVVKEVKGSIPVIVGTGTNDAEHVIHNNKIAEECGADGLLIVTPYYNKSTQEGLFQTFKYYADNTKLPIMLYNVASRTGINMEPEIAIRLYDECENIFAVKEASGDITQIAKLIATKPEGLKVYSGNDDQALPLLALGGNGLISVIGNICPVEIAKMVHSTIKGDLKTAQKINNKLNQLMNSIFLEVNPIPIKYAASLLNICNNNLRLPLIPITKENGLFLKNVMKEVGLL